MTGHTVYKTIRNNTQNFENVYVKNHVFEETPSLLSDFQRDV